MRKVLGCSVVVLLFSAASASAQKRAAKLDGAWVVVHEKIVAPDTTIEYSGPPGLLIISGRYYSQIFLNAPEQGIQQASEPSTVEGKAARYDLLTANAGIDEISDTLITIHIQYAKSPAAIGGTFQSSYRIRG